MDTYSTTISYISKLIKMTTFFDKYIDTYIL